MVEAGYLESSKGASRDLGSKGLDAQSSEKPKCPECRSLRLFRSGLRYLADGRSVQRWLCRDCGYRFSEENGRDLNPLEKPLQENSKWNLKTHGNLSYRRQVCALRQAKNLATETRQRKVQWEDATKAEIQGKIVEHLWHLKKQGYAESTVKVRTRILKQLAEEGVNLLNPDAVKKAIAVHDNWSEGYKLHIVNAYIRFAEMLGLQWDPPNYRPVKELPFIPLEREIDALIAGCGKKVAASLQLLKETAMRIGEVWMLRWTDIDEERQTIKCRPEKHANPRMFKISTKLIAMLNTLPEISERLFGGRTLNGHRGNFIKQRRRLARKLQNPRLEKITFHTFRHWKATMEYHKTKDILHVQRLLGHRNIQNTLLYTQLVDFECDDAFTCRVANTVEEATQLIEAGFEFVTDMNDVKLFRKRR